MNKESKIYVAGHRGLVGSAICKVLETNGYWNVIGRTIDELNLLDGAAVHAFFKKEKPDFVILAAAKVGGIAANNTYRGEFIYENLMIQNNVVHASYLNGVKKLLFLGSTCIYPRDASQPLKEDSLLSSPLEYTNEPYAIAKIAGIKLCESYNLQYGTNFISVMPTNLYGPNDNFDFEKSHVLPAMLRKIHLGKCLENDDFDAIDIDLTARPVKGSANQHSHFEKNTSKRVSLMEAILESYGIYKNPDSGTVSVEIWGTGRPMREFLWSEEMAEACVFIMEHVNFQDLCSQNPLLSFSASTNSANEIRNTHINIGTGKEISIYDLARLVARKVNFKGNLHFNEAKPDGTMRKLTDPTRLHTLGWKHKIEIEEGVGKLYDWYLATRKSNAE